MNNIHEKDWAEESWTGHTGMNSLCDHSLVTNKTDEGLQDPHEAATDHNGITEQE